MTSWRQHSRGALGVSRSVRCLKTQGGVALVFSLSLFWAPSSAQTDPQRVPRCPPAQSFTFLGKIADGAARVAHAGPRDVKRRSLISEPLLAVRWRPGLARQRAPREERNRRTQLGRLGAYAPLRTRLLVSHSRSHTGLDGRANVRIGTVLSCAHRWLPAPIGSGQSDRIIAIAC